MGSKRTQRKWGTTLKLAGIVASFSFVFFALAGTPAEALTIINDEAVFGKTVDFLGETVYKAKASLQKQLTVNGRALMRGEVTLQDKTTIQRLNTDGLAILKGRTMIGNGTHAASIDSLYWGVTPRGMMWGINEVRSKDGGMLKLKGQDGLLLNGYTGTVRMLTDGLLKFESGKLEWSGNNLDFGAVNLASIDAGNKMTVSGNSVELAADGGTLALTGDGANDIDISNAGGTVDVDATTTDISGKVDLSGTGGSSGDADLDVAGYAQFAGDVEVDGDTDLDGRLSVDGTSTLDKTTIDGTLEVNDTTTINSNLGVTGVADISTSLINSDDVLTIDDDAYVTGAFSVDGNSVFRGTLSNDGGVLTVDDEMNVLDTAYLNGGIDVNTGEFTVDTSGNTYVDGTLDVAGLASLDGGIDMDGMFTVANNSGNVASYGTLTQYSSASFRGGIDSDIGMFTVQDNTGNTQTQGTLTVGQNAYLRGPISNDTGGDLNIQDSTSITGALDVSLLTSLDGGIYVDGGEFSVAGDGTGNTYIDGTLGVNDNATFYSAVDVWGGLDAQSMLYNSLGTLHLDDDVLVSENLEVQGALSDSTKDLLVNDSLDVTGTLDAQTLVYNSTGDLTLNDNVDVSGNMDIDGNVALTGTLSDSTGSLTLDDDTDVYGDFSVSGDAYVDGYLVGVDGSETLGTVGTRWSTLYVGTVNFDTAITDANDDDTTVTIGDSGVNDTVSITANTEINDQNWGIQQNGQAMFADGMFTVANSTGNTSIHGALDVRGGISDQTGGVERLELTDADGTTVYGVLDVRSGIDNDAGDVNVDDPFNVTGANATYLSGTLDVEGQVDLGNPGGGADTHVYGGLEVDEFSAFNDGADFGMDGTGFGYAFHSNTSGENMFWDGNNVNPSLQITGTDSQIALNVLDGDVDVADDIGVAGSVYVDTGLEVGTSQEFTVDGSNGNTGVAGTLGVAGLASLDGGIDVNSSVFTVDGNGTTTITTPMSFMPGLQVNMGDVFIQDRFALGAFFWMTDGTGTHQYLPVLSSFMVVSENPLLMGDSIELDNMASGFGPQPIDGQKLTLLGDPTGAAGVMIFGSIPNQMISGGSPVFLSPGDSISFVYLAATDMWYETGRSFGNAP